MSTIRPLFLALIMSAFLSACGGKPETAVTSTTSTSRPPTYPFAYIDTKREVRKNDNSYNEMLLYTCGDIPNIDSLRMFCADKKKEFTEGVFHIIVFFDKKENTEFPKNPVTGGYMEEKPAKHIKAIYTYNVINHYSKLDCYDKNSWQSTPRTIEIN